MVVLRHRDRMRAAGLLPGEAASRDDCPPRDPPEGMGQEALPMGGRSLDWGWPHSTGHRASLGGPDGTEGPGNFTGTTAQVRRGALAFPCLVATPDHACCQRRCFLGDPPANGPLFGVLLLIVVKAAVVVPTPAQPGQSTGRLRVNSVVAALATAAGSVSAPLKVLALTGPGPSSQSGPPANGWRIRPGVCAGGCTFRFPRRQ